MALTSAQIVDHPALHDFIRRQSQALVMAYESNPRLSSVFATQQRWLMGHIGLALYYRRAPGHTGLTVARFLETVSEHSVASRNTADAFLKEMLNYNFIRYGTESSDRRTRPLEPAQLALDAVRGWAMVHLATLDAIDSGNRLTAFTAAPDGLQAIQPHICDGLLTATEIREPKNTFSLFTWLNNGGIIMDRLIAGMADAEPNAERIATSITSIAEMGKWLSLSRTHLSRKLREAESLGSIGWLGRRGDSVMWVSKGFRQEYIAAQAAKLTVIDAAFDKAFPSTG